jgi:hypothetical protein
MSQSDQKNASDADQHYCRLIASLQGAQFVEVWYRLKHAGDEDPRLVWPGVAEGTGSNPPAVATNH